VGQLRSRDRRLFSRAIRSIVAGTSSLQPIADVFAQKTAGRTGLHILVAEDNEISQQIIAMMLQAGGHHVTVVSDGDTVLQNYQSVSFDVIILDMHMPGRTGLEVAKVIRALERKDHRRRMPIIMLTAAASVDLREDSLGAGVDLFLSKPVDPRALLRGVSRVFSEAPALATHRIPTPSVREAQQEYVDHILLQDMAGLANDSHFIQTLSNRFSKDARHLIKEIKAALGRGDHKQFQEKVHALKGAAMMAGAIRLRDSAARIENISSADFKSIGAEVVEDLMSTLEATNHELSRMVA
jgi:two-component system sensor histidine kinase RpfC